jgi:hypothetical protein
MLITPTATHGASAVGIIDPIGAVAVTAAGIIGAVGVVDTDADGVVVAGLIKNNLVMFNRQSLFSAILLALLGAITAHAQSAYPPGRPPGYGAPSGYPWHDADRRVIRAVYGAHGRYADVTGIVRHFARTGSPFRVSNETFGVDPYQGRTKRLRVTIAGPDGATFERIWQEGDRARL